MNRRLSSLMGMVDSLDLRDPFLKKFFPFALERANEGNYSYLDFMAELEQTPAEIPDFLDSNEFLGATDLKVWQEVRKAFCEIMAKWWRGIEYGAYDMLLAGGATGTGKTELAKGIFAYYLHVLGCMSNPQQYYGLPSSTPIVYSVHAHKPATVKRAIYEPLRKMISQMPWFLENMPMDQNITASIYFPDKNIYVVMAGSDENAILGEAVNSSIIDEINFMRIVVNSKKAQSNTGRSGTYDQAEQLFATCKSRRTGRFHSQGPNIGMTVAMSSIVHNNDFLSKRIREYRANPELYPSTYVYEKAQYDVTELRKFSGKKFYVMVANSAVADTRILEPDEVAPLGARVIGVPVEYESLFRTNLRKALADICGIADNSYSPFFQNRMPIINSAQAWLDEGNSSFLVNDHVVMAVDGMPQVRPGWVCKDRTKNRYAHIDLSVTGDSCGIAIVRNDGAIKVERLGGITEILPKCTTELVCTITPDPNNPIILSDVRAWIMYLKNTHRIPIRMVSYDGFASIESRQELRRQGMPTKLISVDKGSKHYSAMKEALNDCRLLIPNDTVLMDELSNLEFDAVKDKVDHPPLGSKDAADAVCGAYALAISRSKTWTEDDSSDRRSSGGRRSMPRADAKSVGERRSRYEPVGVDEGP